MIKYFHIGFLLVVILGIGTNASAQKTDFRVRAGAKVQKDLTRKLTASLEYEHRFDNNLSTFDKALIEPALSYSLCKKVRLGVEWRFMIDQNRVRQISYKHRAGISARYQFAFDDFDFKLRTALQYGFDELTLSTGNDQKLTNRNLVEVEYNWFGQKITPFASYEFFCYVNNPNGAIINQWRLKAGASYRFSRQTDISAYYMYEKEFNVAYPVNANVIGLTFSYKM